MNFKKTNKLNKLYLGLVVLVTPNLAFAFPFIMTGTGFSLVPFLFAALASIQKKKQFIILNTLLGLIVYKLTTDPYSEMVGQQEKNDNALAFMYEQEELLSKSIVGGLDASKSVKYRDLENDIHRVYYVNEGGKEHFPGVSINELITNRQYIDPQAIIVSSSKYLTENASRATGLRYIDQSVPEIIASFAAEDTATQNDSCSNSDCVKVALIDGYQYLMAGYPYKKFDETLTMASLIIPNMGGINRLKELTDNGKKPIFIEYFSTQNTPHFASGLSGYLKKQGLRNTTVHKFNEVDKTTSNFKSLSKNIFNVDHITDFSELSVLCQHKTDIIMTSNFAERNRILLPEYIFENCDIHNIPIEGMTAHEAIKETQKHMSMIDPARRYVGVYHDKTSAFYTGIAIDALSEKGIPAIGISAITYNVKHLESSNSLLGYLDLMVLKLRKVTNTDGQINFAQFSTSIALASFILFHFFCTSRNKLTYLGLWTAYIGLNIFASYAYYYAPVQKVINPIDSLIVLLIIQYALYLLVYRQKPMVSKYQSLVWLKRNGFVTPEFYLLRKLPSRNLIKWLSKRHSRPVIFRSNELLHENEGAKFSGRFDSVVVSHPDQINNLHIAWMKMQQYGAPSLIAQHHINFDESGVATCCHDKNGKTIFVVQKSNAAEGVTSNLTDEVSTTVLDKESARLSGDQLHNELGRIHDSISCNFIAEFGIKNSKLFWLQLTKNPTSDIYFSNDNESKRFHVSHVNNELDVKSPLLLSLLNKYNLLTTYKILNGTIYERRSSFAYPVYKALSLIPLAPLFLIAKCLQAKQISRKDKQCLNIVRFASILDSASQMASNRNIFVGYSTNMISSFTFENIDPDEKIIPKKSHIALAIREICRDILVRETKKDHALVCKIASETGFQTNAIPTMQIECIDRKAMKINKDFASYTLEIDVLDAYVTKGPKTPNQTAVSIDKRENISQIQQSEGDNLTVRLTNAWIEIFNHADRIAEIILPKLIHSNSHFIQCARSHGISVKIEP